MIFFTDKFDLFCTDIDISQIEFNNLRFIIIYWTVFPTNYFVKTTQTNCQENVENALINQF